MSTDLNQPALNLLYSPAGVADSINLGDHFRIPANGDPHTQALSCQSFNQLLASATGEVSGDNSVILQDRLRSMQVENCGGSKSKQIKPNESMKSQNLSFWEYLRLFFLQLSRPWRSLTLIILRCANVSCSISSTLFIRHLWLSQLLSQSMAQSSSSLIPPPADPASRANHRLGVRTVTRGFLAAQLALSPIWPRHSAPAKDLRVRSAKGEDPGRKFLEGCAPPSRT